MTYVMFDTATPAALPPTGFDVTAGYVAGCRYPSSDAIKARFPHLPHLTIATHVTQDAMCIDVEPRYVQPEDAPAWVDRMHTQGVAVPVVYTSASWTARTRAALGRRRYLLWSAHYTHAPHICGDCGYPPADATQWTDKGPGGVNVDQSLLSDPFYAVVAGGGPPTAPTKEDDMGYLARCVTGAVVFIGVLGPRGVADPSALGTLEALGFTYGPRGGNPDAFKSMDEGPFRLLIEVNGGTP